MLCVTAYIDCVQSYGPQGIQQQGREVEVREEDCGSSRKHRQGARGRPKKERESAKCEWCAVSYTKKPNQIGEFCSNHCYRKSRAKEPYWLKCSACLAKIGLNQSDISKILNVPASRLTWNFSRFKIKTQKPTIAFYYSYKGFAAGSLNRPKSICIFCSKDFYPVRGAVGKYCSKQCAKEHQVQPADWLQCSSCLAKIGFGMAVVAKTFGITKQTVLRQWRRYGISSQKPKCISWKHYAATQITWIRYDHYDAWMTEYKPKFFDWSCLVSFEKNKERCRKYQSERFKNSSASDSFRLKKVVRCRVYNALRRSLRNAKPRISERTTQLIGCSIEFLKQYLESKFKKGMGWHNYGHGWHIDHIVPLSSFNLLDPNQLATACHYTNLQPMWAVENLKKSDRITENRQLCLPIHVTH